MQKHIGRTTKFNLFYCNMNSQNLSDRMLTMIKSSDEQSYFNIDQQNDDRNWDVSAKGPVYKKKQFNVNGLN